MTTSLARPSSLVSGQSPRLPSSAATDLRFPSLLPHSSTEDTPWYDGYRRAFFRLIQPSDHEYFNHPLAAVVIATVHAENPIAEMLSAFQPAQVSRAFWTEM